MLCLTGPVRTVQVAYRRPADISFAATPSMRADSAEVKSVCSTGARRLIGGTRRLCDDGSCTNEKIPAHALAEMCPCYAATMKYLKSKGGTAVK